MRAGLIEEGKDVDIVKTSSACTWTGTNRFTPNNPHRRRYKYIHARRDHTELLQMMMYMPRSVASRCLSEICQPTFKQLSYTFPGNFAINVIRCITLCSHNFRDR